MVQQGLAVLHASLVCSCNMTIHASIMNMHAPLPSPRGEPESPEETCLCRKSCLCKRSARRVASVKLVFECRVTQHKRGNKEVSCSTTCCCCCWRGAFWNHMTFIVWTHGIFCKCVIFMVTVANMQWESYSFENSAWYENAKCSLKHVKVQHRSWHKCKYFDVKQLLKYDV